MQWELPASQFHSDPHQTACVYWEIEPETLSILFSSGSQSVVPGPAASASPGNLLEMQILGSTPDLLNQNP